MLKVGLGVVLDCIRLVLIWVGGWLELYWELLGWGYKVNEIGLDGVGFHWAALNWGGVAVSGWVWVRSVN